MGACDKFGAVGGKAAEAGGWDDAGTATIGCLVVDVLRDLEEEVDEDELLEFEVDEVPGAVEGGA